MLEENSRLNAELLLANVKLQRLEFLEHENSQLRSLLHYSKQIKGKILVSQLLLSVVDKFGQQITVDKGKEQGVYVGQPALDAHGLLGQVIAVEDNISRVLLITNRKSAIPVMIIRNELLAIAVGTDDGDYLELINVSETADIKVGDSLVTSGLEGRFSAGYQVGIVKEIKHIVGERFVKVLVQPVAQVNSGNLHVLLIWPDLVEKTKLVKKASKKSK